MSGEISEVVIISIAGTAIVLFLLIFLLTIFFVYQRRYLLHQQEKARIHAQYALELLRTQVEVQNLTMQKTAQELHDNIGQLLSVAKINLNILEENGHKGEDQDYIVQTNEIIGQVISDVRALTRSFDGDFVKDFGLVDGISQELARLRKTKKYQLELELSGTIYSLGYEKEIVLFRIFQETLNNSIRHAEASKIKAVISYEIEEFSMSVQDNGKGFEYSESLETLRMQTGAGLRNIRRRVDMLGGILIIETQINAGTSIRIRIRNPEII